MSTNSNNEQFTMGRVDRSTRLDGEDFVVNKSAPESTKMRAYKKNEVRNLSSHSKIFSLNCGHDSGVAYLEDGKVVWMIEEERYSHRKKDSHPFLSIANANNLVDPNSVVMYTSLEVPLCPDIVENTLEFALLLVSKVLRKNKYQYKDFLKQHHLSHASIGFYNSGFEEAVVVVVDGAGAITTENNDGHEVESIYKASYPDKFELLHQKYCPTFEKLEKHTIEDPTSGIGMVYSAVADYLGFSFAGSGKLMGLAPYGKEDENILSYLNEDGSINEDLIVRVENGFMQEYYEYIIPAGSYNVLKFQESGIPKRVVEDREHHTGKQGSNYLVHIGPGLRVPDVADPSKKFPIQCNLAYRIQKDFEKYMINLLKKAVDISGCKNIVLSGGCALNCVANYEYLKHLPEGTKLFVEPICYDAGLVAGQAMLEWRQRTKSMEIRPLKSLYLGPERTHILPRDVYDTTPSDVIDLIEQKKAVAIFQGRSEQGPRALGNRSLLFDPRVPDARILMNKIKGRELFRPFAATVLLEHVHDWFDMRSLEESPFMMFALNAHEKVWDIIPGVLHNDKTCRIQTLTREQNPKYYELIEEFYNRTGVPMLLNTSFNLGGDTICETVDDAVNTLSRSAIDYVYFAEQYKMLHIPENSNSGRKGKINYELHD